MSKEYWENSFSNDSIDFHTQLRELGLSVESLKEKSVLDIGSGGARFAEGAKDENINTKIISLDPKYSLPKNLKLKITGGEDTTMKRVKEKQLPIVVGLAESLPFSDKSFDLVIANCSVPYYQPDKNLKAKSISEIIRVLKPGGEARITMVVKDDEDIIKDVVGKLQDCKLEINDSVLIIKRNEPKKQK
jgi:ubiquinone/menaquinone biosynthesis C-methylase UbiE